ncbi:MAG: isocitrate lyase/PEP mutase family protein [Dehalococcoidia bacterium]
MELSERRRRLRALLASDACIGPASVFDPLSARAAALLGYEMMMLAGSVASATVLGAPDLIVLTLSEFAEQARRITRAADLPLLVDADHGYGNALNVMRCVQELETAGVAALTIEDTVLPRAYGAVAESLVSLEEAVGKLRAAVAARGDPALVILGRTIAIRTEGLAGCVRRVEAYAGTGIDGLFFVGVQTRAELEALRRVTVLPFVLGGGSAELRDPAYLAAQGVPIRLLGHAPFHAAARAAYDVLKSQRPESAAAEPPADLLATLTAQAQYDRDMARFLSIGDEKSHT